MNKTDISGEGPCGEESGEERRRLNRLLEVYERDRQLLAFEIHDGLAQHLTAARAHCETCRRLREENPQQSERSCETAVELLARSIGEARRLIRGLQPPVLEHAGLISAIDQLVGECQHNGNPRIHFSHRVLAERFPRPMENAVYRIIQESLTNACRYSRSERICVELVQANDCLYIHVRDWGVGFDPAEVDGHCLGLRGIRERARLLGGRTVVNAAAGQGTQIAVELPLEPKPTESPDS
ncbi:MAG TPA: sensor histidine kinase [Thermoguttaceae bacterium]|nr:sensor histidine kinase [Thermoguttaceae bacterium]